METQEKNREQASLTLARWVTRTTGRVFTWMHKFYIAQTAIYFVYFGTIAVWAFLADYWKQTSLLEFVVGKPFLMWTAAFFSTALTVSLLVLFRFVRHRRAEFERHVAMAKKAEKNKKIEPLFLKIAYTNAACDTRLFVTFLDLLDLIPERSGPHVLARLETARQAVTGNIRDLADTGKEIFNAVTGDACAVSIKLLSANHASLGSSVVTAFLRDSESASARGRVDEVSYRVDDNTAFSSICLKGEPCFVCDDLVAEAAAKKYVNKRPGWQRDYNATIVVPIYAISKPDLNQKPQELLGFFCADNRAGGFDQPEAIRYARELGWRLSVMLYRHAALEARAEAARLETSAERTNRKHDRKGPE